MAAYRCQHCTLIRCDAPNQSCAECLGNIGDAPSVGPFVYMYSIAPVTPYRPVQGAPGTPPPTLPTLAHTFTIPPGVVKKYVRSLAREDAAGMIRDWIHDSIHPWGGTQKGADFWLDIWNELDEISRGRAP